MATLPKNDAAEPIVAGEILLVHVSDVRRGERLRPIDPVWAGALGGIMAREGQQTPIEICREPGKSGWLIVAGGHRHAGAEIVGMELIEAREVSGSKAHRRMREVTENLWRRDLDPVDRSAFIAELVQLKRAHAGIEETAHRDASIPRAVRDEAKRTLDTMSNVYGFTVEVAADLGLSDRTLRRDLLLYRSLRPSVIELLRENRHPILKNAAQLRQLAKLDAGEQERVAARMIDQGYGAPKSVADAVLLVRGTNRPVADPAFKRFNTILGTLGRMDAKELRGLFQSPEFHNAIPAEAQRLLAPMRCDPEGLE
jgi:ParB-like chromosome segregation protein Spo0J